MERSELYDPVIDGEQYYTYHRKPTESEIKRGFGATHYRDFPESQVRKPGFRIKKWLKADGLRYYR